jgi:hypothetical protein
MKHCCVFHSINASFSLCGGVAISFHAVWLIIAGFSATRCKGFSISRARIAPCHIKRIRRSRVPADLTAFVFPKGKSNNPGG